MYGDYDEPDSSQLGHFDWPVAALVALVIVLGVFSFFAAGCVQGAEPVTFTVVNRVPPKFEVVNRIPPAAKSAVPQRLIGWDVPQPDGSVLFVPVQPAPAGPLTIPAEAPPRPFVPPPVVPGGSTAHMTAPSVGVPNTSLPVPVPFRVPTGMYALPGIPGGINGCTSYG